MPRERSRQNVPRQAPVLNRVLPVDAKMSPIAVLCIYQPTVRFAFLFDAGCALRSLWGECSECDSSNSAEWKCPLAAQVYNALADNPAGSAAEIIETSGAAGNRTENVAVLAPCTAAHTAGNVVFPAQRSNLERVRTAVVFPPSYMNPSLLLPLFGSERFWLLIVSRPRCTVFPQAPSAVTSLKTRSTMS